MKTWGLTLVSVLLALGVAEGVLRLFGVGAAARGTVWFAGGNHPRFLFQPDAQSGYALRPGFHGREIARTGDFDVEVAIDAAGMRQHARSASGSPVVLALGDSLTFGEGVEVERAFPAELERALGRRVLNAGVPGYGSPQMRARLESLLNKVRPRLVLMSFWAHADRVRAATPFVYHEGYIVSARYMDRLYLIGGNLYGSEVDLPLLGPASAYAQARSNLVRMTLPRLMLLGKQLRGPRPEVTPGPQAHEGTLEAVAAAHHLAGASGAELLVVLLEAKGFGAQPARDRDILDARLTERGIPHATLDALLPETDWEALRHRRDTHWNAAGHRAVAEALVPFIEERLHAE